MEILGPIGEGGMGLVYHSGDPRLDHRESNWHLESSPGPLNFSGQLWQPIIVSNRDHAEALLGVILLR